MLYVPRLCNGLYMPLSLLTAIDSGSHEKHMQVRRQGPNYADLQPVMLLPMGPLKSHEMTEHHLVRLVNEVDGPCSDKDLKTQL